MEKIFTCIYDIKNGEYKSIINEGLKYIKTEKIIKPGSNVMIKPNFTWPIYKEGVTTTPLLLDHLTTILKKYTNKIYIGESNGANNSWTADQCFKGHGLYKLAKNNGFKLINLTKQKATLKKVKINNKFFEFKVSKFILDKIDVLITVPVLKMHAATNVSLGLKNQWGCLPDPMRLLYHPFLHEGIVAVNKIYKPRISIIDATFGLNKTGPISGIPIKLNKIMISNNITALDILACAFMGISYRNIKHINIAKKEFLKDFEIEEITKCGNFKSKFKFNLKRSFYEIVSNFVSFHKDFNNLFYNSLFSNYIQRILQFYKVLFRRENTY